MRVDYMCIIRYLFIMSFVFCSFWKEGSYLAIGLHILISVVLSAHRATYE